MLSFTQFLKEMAARSPERADKLLKYVHHRYLGVDGEQMRNPIPRAARRPAVPMVDFDYGQGQLRDVPVHSIVSGQSHVSSEVVSKKIRGQWKQHEPEIPWFVHHEGTHYLIDGNHRAVEAKFKGMSHIKGLVIDAKPGTAWHTYFNSAARHKDEYEDEYEHDYNSGGWRR